MGGSFFHQINYIYWKKEAERVGLRREAWLEKLQELDRITGGNIAKSKSCRKDWIFRPAFMIERHGDWHILFHYDIDRNKWVYYMSNIWDDAKNREGLYKMGTRAIISLNAKFKEDNGVTLKGAFGYSEKETVNKCVPKSIFYRNEAFLNRKMTYGSIDVSSAFPFCAGGLLPDARTEKRCSGTVKPTAEYPFAIYLKSGHSAEFGRYDTHDWENSKFAPELLYSNPNYTPCNPEEDETILYKPSDYELTDTFQYFYNMKNQGDPDAKNVMNAGIGMMHQRSDRTYRLYHLAVFILGRENDMILKKCQEIGEISIAHIAVDGIIYKGPEKHGQDKKELGAFVQEVTNGYGRVMGCNQYILFSDHECKHLKKVSHAAFNSTDDGSDIDHPKDLDAMDHWARFNQDQTLREEILKYEQEIYQKAGREIEDLSATGEDLQGEE